MEFYGILENQVQREKKAELLPKFAFLGVLNTKF